MLIRLQKPIVRSSILNGLSKIPIYDLLYRLNQDKGIVLVYHQVRDSNSFEKQIAFISCRYHVLPLEELIILVTNGKPLPKRSLSITFDDGYYNIYENAYPILLKYQCAATVFITTAFIDNVKPIWPFWVQEYIFQSKEPLLQFQSGDFKFIMDISHNKGKINAYRKLVTLLKHELQAELWLNLDRLWEATGKPEIKWNRDNLLLTWDQVRIMNESGWIRFGNHTDSHRILPWIGSSSLGAEIDRADMILKSHLSFPSPTFAFPNGEYDGRAVMNLKEKRYIGAVTTQEMFITSHSGPMRLGRIGANHEENIPFLKLRLCGALPTAKIIINASKSKI